jgi:hypothetical protein
MLYISAIDRCCLKFKHSGLVKAFLLTCFLFSQCPPLAATSLDVECLTFKPEYFEMYPYIDSRHHPGLEATYTSICGLVKEGIWDREKASKYIYPYIFRLAVCRLRGINPEYQRFLEQQSGIPESVVLAHNRFCETTFDPEYKWIGEKYKNLRNKKGWLGKESFCLAVREMAYPSGFFERLFDPDVPSVKNYRSVTDTICQQLRNGDIEFSEAVYRWEQANLELDKHFNADIVIKMGQDLKKPIEKLVDMFVKIK